MVKIKLIATKIDFTRHSIVYRVKFSDDKSYSGITVCHNNIKHKDLILKPTFINDESMEIIFTTNNLTSHFYQSILDGSIRNAQEYKVDLNNIYGVGDVVGYILV